jgi:membrane protein YdbS with pleckstrin-like domain
VVDREEPAGDGRPDRPVPPREHAPSASSGITPVPVEDGGDGTGGETHAHTAPIAVTTTTTRYDDAGLVVGPPHIEATRNQPSRIVGKYLFESERYCGEWRRHWIYVARWTSIGVISPFVVGYIVGAVGENAGAIVTAVLFLWLGLLLFVGFKLMDWYYDRFVLTDKRVMVVGGIVTRRVGMMPLARVTDMAYLQSPLGRILNYGTFVLESAGQDQALREIKPLPHPGELYLLFCQEMYEPGSSTAQQIDDASGD